MDEEVRTYVQAFLNELREINASLTKLIEFMEDKPKTVREVLDREGLV